MGKPSAQAPPSFWPLVILNIAALPGLSLLIWTELISTDTGLIYFAFPPAILAVLLSILVAAVDAGLLLIALRNKGTAGSGGGKLAISIGGKSELLLGAAVASVVVLLFALLIKSVM